MADLTAVVEGDIVSSGGNCQLLVNGQIFTGEEILSKREVLLANGRIQTVHLSSRATDHVTVVDLNGGLLAPGFIDCQVNGGGGVMFNDRPAPDIIAAMIKAHRSFGTTGMLPTLISDEWGTMQAAADAVRSAYRLGLPGLLGLHFEGPYLNPEKHGAHSKIQIRGLDSGLLELLGADDLGQVVMTLAPEMVPAGLIRDLTNAGVKVCAGHCAPDAHQIADALKEGLVGFTHLFNAMPPMSSRTPGIVGAALDDENTWCGIIADGHHVDPVTLSVAVAAKITGRMMLVTDATAPVGTNSEIFQMSGQSVTVKNGRCILHDGTLAGSCLDMASAVRNTHNLVGLPLEEALRMASLYPAAFLGMEDQRGRIVEGYCADLVLLDDDLKVLCTWIDGAMQEN